MKNTEWTKALSPDMPIQMHESKNAPMDVKVADGERRNFTGNESRAFVHRKRQAATQARARTRFTGNAKTEIICSMRSLIFAKITKCMIISPLISRLYQLFGHLKTDLIGY